MIRTLVLACALVGCAQQKPDPQHPENGSGSNVTCHEVTDTGSMFSHTECTPIDEKTAEHDDAQRWVKRPRSQPSGGK